MESCLQFLHNNPVTTVLLIAYTVAMISGTTYLYKDMLGWYPDLVKGYFLDHFSVRESFIEATMRRTDYRFFPLAHQDLHILSWFSIHIKTWMLFSAAELIGIILLSVKFLNNLGKQPWARASTVLLITSLLLIHPSTGTAFFQVIYCERLLCLVFMLYINAYLLHLKTLSNSTLYATLLWALIGIYIKDIAILLFIIPPASIWAANTINMRHKARHFSHNLPSFNRGQPLEHWLCSGSINNISLSRTAVHGPRKPDSLNERATQRRPHVIHISPGLTRRSRRSLCALRILLAHLCQLSRAGQ